MRTIKRDTTEIGNIGADSFLGTDSKSLDSFNRNYAADTSCQVTDRTSSSTFAEFK